MVNAKLTAGTKLKSKSYFFSAGLISVSLLGIILVMISTRWGAFLSDDSFYYIKPARDALAGEGFNPSPIFAPFLPAVLTVLGWLGIEPLLGVRILNAGLFGLNIMLSGIILLELGALPVFAIIAALVVSLSKNSIEAHSWAHSEASAIFFSLSALYLAIRYIRLRAWPCLLGSAICAALACLSRFAALPVVGAIGIGLLIWPRSDSLKRRLLNITIHGLVSVVPLGLYFLRTNQLLGRPLYYRTYTYVPFTLQDLIWYLYNTLNWFIPGRFLVGRELIAAAIIGALILVGIVTLLWYSKRQYNGNKLKILKPATWFLLLFVFFNYLMLFFARGLSHLGLPNNRYLVPPLLVLLLLGVYLVDQLWKLSRSTLRLFLVAACVIFIAYYGYRAADLTRAMNNWGLGYSNRGWHNSETIPYLEQRPNMEVVATGSLGIYFWTDSVPLQINIFPSHQDMRAHLCATQGELVIIKSMPPELYGLQEMEIINGLQLKHDFNDSKIFACPE